MSARAPALSLHYSQGKIPGQKVECVCQSLAGWDPETCSGITGLGTDTNLTFAMFHSALAASDTQGVVLKGNTKHFPISSITLSDGPGIWISWVGYFPRGKMA